MPEKLTMLGTVALAGVNPSGDPKFIDGTYLVAGLDADGEPHILEVDTNGDLVVSGGVGHEYVGYDTIGAATENVTNLRVYLKKITTTSPGLLASIGAYINQNSDNAFGIGVCAMSDNGGIPHRLLGYVPTILDSHLLEISATPTYAAGWVHRPIGLWLSAGSYWIGVQFEASVGTMQLHYDTGGSDRYYTAGGFWFAHAGRYAETDSTRRFSIRGSLVT